MTDQWEIMDTLRPLRRPMYLATAEEKQRMLVALRVFSLATPGQVLAAVGGMLGRPLKDLTTLRSSEARRVMETCERERRRRR